MSVSDLDADELEKLAHRAIALAELWSQRRMPQPLVGSRFGLIAELPGWRNPTALALGVQAMGGNCVSVTARLEGSETVEDLAEYMDNWFDLLAIRTPSLQRLTDFASTLKAPVMNLRTNDNHPCEVIGDLAYILSQRGSWDGLRVAIVGPKGNIAQSWVEAAEVLPIQLLQVSPPEMALTLEGRGRNGSITQSLDAAKDVDVIITDCWPPNATETDRAALLKQRIDAALLDACQPEVLFIPCPPVTRGEEVTADAMYHPRCVATPAKAFLMHAQNAFVEQAIATR
jgi:ornithine carbamoyltransferase